MVNMEEEEAMVDNEFNGVMFCRFGVYYSMIRFHLECNGHNLQSCKSTVWKKFALTSVGGICHDFVVDVSLCLNILGPSFTPKLLLL